MQVLDYLNSELEQVRVPKYFLDIIEQHFGIEMTNEKIQKMLCNLFTIKETPVNIQIVPDTTKLYNISNPKTTSYSICSFLDSGNLEVIGTHIISGIIDDINREIELVQKLDTGGEINVSGSI